MVLIDVMLFVQTVVGMSFVVVVAIVVVLESGKLGSFSQALVVGVVGVLGVVGVVGDGLVVVVVGSR